MNNLLNDSLISIISKKKFLLKQFELIKSPDI